VSNRPGDLFGKKRQLWNKLEYTLPNEPNHFFACGHNRQFWMLDMPDPWDFTQTRTPGYYGVAVSRLCVALNLRNLGYGVRRDERYPTTPRSGRSAHA